MRDDYTFTSESVSEGHPDKLCDQISDAVLDYALSIDPEARMACEVYATTNRLIIGGEYRITYKGDDVREFTSATHEEHMENINGIAREVVKEIGYDQPGFSHHAVEITNLMHGQSAQIAAGVDATADKAEGAGDQGIMFGYACDETDALMPAPLHYSHLILQHLQHARRVGRLPDLGPDAKAQVSIRYADGQPREVTGIVVSHQQSDRVSVADVYDMVRPYVEGVFAGKLHISSACTWHINPAGKFVIGGPYGDTGLTGRKIIVDTYGGAAPHGGGAFSGKDPTKVDRSAAYMARALAKSIVAAGFARRCTIQLAYAIGVAEPLSIYVDLHGTATRRDGDLEARLENWLWSKRYGLTPAGIRKTLSLNRPIYQPTAAYGHFGRDTHDGTLFPWEDTSQAVPILQKAFG